MIGSLIVSNELRIINLSRDKEVFRFVFDIEQIPTDELLWLIEQYKMLKRLVRQGVPIAEAYRIVGREAEKILRKGVVKGNRFMFFDPALAAAAHLLVDNWSAVDIGLWWCDYGTRGKLFTQSLCKRPCFDYSRDEDSRGAAGRRAVALNPWNIGNWADLDTIIDQKGYHKSGTIGTAPFTFSKSVVSNAASILATFVAASSTTIGSVLLLIPTNETPTYEPSCYDSKPAPPGTCHSGYYASIYLPLWGWDVNVSISQGEQYAVKIKFYV